MPNTMTTSELEELITNIGRFRSAHRQQLSTRGVGTIIDMVRIIENELETRKPKYVRITSTLCARSGD